MTRDFIDKLISSYAYLADKEYFPVSSIPVIEDAYRPVYKSSQASKDAGENVFSCKYGFDTAYEKPESRGGVYVQREDLNALFMIGAQDFKRKITGCSEYWSDKESKLIGGYALYAMRRNSSGKLMVSRKNGNTSPIPESGEDDQNWMGLKNECVLNGSHQVSTEEFYSHPPVAKTTTNFLFARIRVPSHYHNGTKEPVVVRIFPRVLGPTGSGTSAIGLCDQGICIAKVSPFNDIYTNKFHSDMFVVSNSWRHNLYHNALVPMLTNTDYFLYLEYANGCAREPDQRPTYSSIVAYAYHPAMKGRQI